MSKISVVIPIWHRSSKHLDDLLKTIASQVYEVIVVDMSTLDEYTKEISQACDSNGVNRIAIPSNRFNVSRCVNIGIKNTSNESDVVVCTGSEMLFESNAFYNIGRVFDYYNGDVFVRSECGFLKEGVDIDGIFECPFQELNDKVLPFPPKFAGGALLAAPRDWWFSVHGYNEDLPFRLADSCVERRAVNSLCNSKVLEFCVSRIFHQWHDPVQKNRLLGELGGELQGGRFAKEFDIIVNQDVWGKM